jgi:hypothetical protein
LESLAGSALFPHGLLLVGARPGALERTFVELRQELAVMLASFRTAAVVPQAAGR